jgi:endoglucanase
MAVYHKCPHDTAMRWLEDTLDVLKSYNIGWAFWNLRGKFGIMDNGRDDIEMTDFHGHKLDIKMLKLLQKY